MNCVLFVTGTDTEVGKTLVAAGLALAFAKRGLDVGVMKPVATGCHTRRGRRISEDVEYLVGACDSEDEHELICPYMLREPLAPEVAARLERARIDIRRITRAFGELRRRHDVVIVEGAGGLFVPIKRNYFMLDLVAELSSPLLIVARPGLGTINHTLLTCEIARGRRIDVAGIIINNYPRRPSLAERTNPDVLRRYSGARLLGIMPHLPGASVPDGKYNGLLDATEANIDIPRIPNCLRRTSR